MAYKDYGDDKYKKTGVYMGYEPSEDDLLAHTKKDVDKRNTAFGEQEMKDEKKKKLNLGEDSMYTGNPYYDMGLSLGRQRKAKLDASGLSSYKELRQSKRQNKKK